MDISGLSNVYTEYLNQQTDNVSSKKMQDTVSKDYSKASDDELLDVCKQFEAYFMEQVFKQMEKTVIKADESSGNSGALVDYFKDSAIQELTKTSTETQGLGIAQALYEKTTNLTVNINDNNKTTQQSKQRSNQQPTPPH